MKIRNWLGRSFVQFGVKLLDTSNGALVKHELLPAESPFLQVSSILCSDTEDEIRARALVRARTGDEKLARAYMAYVRDVPKGSINDFNQLSAEDRRRYFETSVPLLSKIDA
jgi:regulator of sirC expression with transglutaminase-like and TPR domain